MTKLFTALGLMSGTSLDGVDVAWVRTDGEHHIEHGPAETYPYNETFKRRLRSTLGGVGEVEAVEREMTQFHAQVVHDFLRHHGMSYTEVDYLGFHGHTILHQPQQRKTWQIGDGPLLCRLTKIVTVGDFRTRDVLAGGQGAPLVPVFHRALAEHLPRPLAVLNIGGVANVTWLGLKDEMLAFDTGPGNALIDDWVLQHTGAPYDDGGRLAALGQRNDGAVQQFLSHPYFSLMPPKSLDRDDFAKLAKDLVTGMTAADGAATLTAFTVYSQAMAQTHFHQPPLRWLVTGGGRHNGALMAALSAHLGVPVEPVEAVGWNGDALEAQAFGYLAVRSVKGLPLTYPTTTGSPSPLTGGKLHGSEGLRE